MKGPNALGVGSIIAFLEDRLMVQAIRADSYCTAPRGPSATSVKNYDPALGPLDLSNTTSEPLSRGLCLRLIGDWGARDESKQTKSDG